ncbi:MAG TPA: hypothetical protein VH207_10035 [Chthoniobacterales bacterium]|jgi:hypothetical protein|nr:hypothetical protein [Chthoniobacterales bacterium]
MRLNDRHDGSIKTVLILGLVAANLALTFSHEGAHSQAPGSARASRSVFGALAENRPPNAAIFPEALGEAPIAAREARALPGYLPR